MVSSVTTISKLDLMPNTSMIEKVVQQICASNYLVIKVINVSIYIVIIHLVRMDNMTDKNWSTAYCELNYASAEKFLSS